MTRHSPLLVAGVLMALVGWSGCRPSPEPQTFFAEAEGLRLRYQKAASQQAIAKYREAKTAWRRKGDTSNAARASQQLAATYWTAGIVAGLGGGRTKRRVRGPEGGRPHPRGRDPQRCRHGLSLAADSEDGFGEARGQCQTALSSPNSQTNGRWQRRSTASAKSPISPAPRGGPGVLP